VRTRFECYFGAASVVGDPSMWLLVAGPRVVVAGCKFPPTVPSSRRTQHHQLLTSRGRGNHLFTDNHPQGLTSSLPVVTTHLACHSVSQAKHAGERIVSREAETRLCSIGRARGGLPGSNRRRATKSAANVERPKFAGQLAIYAVCGTDQWM
jgi:hypothetical protein